MVNMHVMRVPKVGKSHELGHVSTHFSTFNVSFFAVEWFLAWAAYTISFHFDLTCIIVQIIPSVC